MPGKQYLTLTLSHKDNPDANAIGLYLLAANQLLFLALSPKHNHNHNYNPHFYFCIAFYGRQTTPQKKSNDLINMNKNAPKIRNRAFEIKKCMFKVIPIEAKNMILNKLFRGSTTDRARDLCGDRDRR